MKKLILILALSFACSPAFATGNVGHHFYKHGMKHYVKKEAVTKPATTTSSKIASGGGKSATTKLLQGAVKIAIIVGAVYIAYRIIHDSDPTEVVKQKNMKNWKAGTNYSFEPGPQ